MSLSDRIVTYSPAYTVVPTYECFNRCSYCNFRQDPGETPWLSLAEAANQLEGLRDRTVVEILVLSGEVHPRSPRRQHWVQHLVQVCELALSLGFLPHTNAGPLSLEEMTQLGRVNVSMGLMVEQITPSLLQTVHRYAPSKVPELRLQQLNQAGALGIPFTTGILVGIGETEADRLDSLKAIAQIHRRWGHLQEVILQPHSPGQRQPWSGDPCKAETLVELVAIAREILPTDVTIQVPPNLVHQPEHLIACLKAGARDLGGIGPQDEVNPDYPHPLDHQLVEILATAGWTLKPRLPVYPQYDRWLPSGLKSCVANWRNKLVVCQADFAGFPTL